MSNTSKPKTVKEPLIRVTKRDILPAWKSWIIRAISIVLALLAVAIFVWAVTGASFGETTNIMIEGAFGNVFYLKGTLFLTAKLLCVAVALAPAFKMRFWNIGAEGQVLVGALATAFVMLKFSSLPTPLLFTLMIVSAMVMGAIWGLLPAIFKAQWNVNETLFTLMMNYVAMQLVDYFYNIWKGENAGLGIINMSTQVGWLPKLGEQINYTVIGIVLAITIIMFIYLRYTKQGYEIAVVGESENTAKYAGIGVKKAIIRTMVISGIVCGICGFLTVAGEDHTVSRDSAGGYGFTAIIVAWLAKFNTLFMIIISLFVVFLEKGTKHVADIYQQQGFDASASKIVIGMVLFFVIGSEFFINYKLHFRGRKED